MQGFYEKARELHENGEYEEALALYRCGMEKGDVRCRYGYAVLLKGGKGIQADLEAGKALLRDSFAGIRALAEGGDAAAMRIVGFYYLNGFHGTREPAVAVEWFRKAAEGGDIAAAYWLGGRYGGGNSCHSSTHNAELHAYFRTFKHIFLLSFIEKYIKSYQKLLKYSTFGSILNTDRNNRNFIHR